jgi:hypothetical protein
MSAQNDRPAGIVSRVSARKTSTPFISGMARSRITKSGTIHRSAATLHGHLWRRANVIPAQAEKSHQQIARHHIVIDDKDLLIGKLILSSSPGMTTARMKPVASPVAPHDGRPR